MGEIKSTMELIMERTRNMTLSKEEKREQALDELRDKVNGVFQRYQDLRITLDEARAELRRLFESSADKPALAATAAERLELGGDNQAMLGLLETVCRMDIRGILAILSDYEKAIEPLDREAAERLGKELAERGISGGAVVPNVTADSQRESQRRKIHESHAARLKEEIARLGCAIAA